ncbi:MAG: SpoIID/LytB domain-containing protein, partial [Planctomycetota bacterium]
DQLDPAAGGHRGQRPGQDRSGERAFCGGIKLIDSRSRVHGYPAGQSVRVLRRRGTGREMPVGVGGTRYPGELLLVPRDDNESAFDIINVAKIESYLPGVLARELYPHWDEDAFGVQAVAARTFALGRRERARRAGRHFDLEATTSDQVYGGISELDVAQRAVMLTRGVVLVDGTSLASAYYSSTCGGRPATADEVWPSDARPTRPSSAELSASDHAVRRVSRQTGRTPVCDDAPLFRWRVARDRDALGQRLRAWGRHTGDGSLAEFGRPAAIEPSAFGASGRPIAYRLTDGRGAEAILTAERLRRALGFAGEGAPTLHPRARVHSNDLQIDIGPRVVIINGRGHGHGAGMCQFCAQAMALNGEHWRSMLAAFYPEAEARRVY